LFAPQTPEPSRLDVTLARLRAMVGEERVGSPVLKDTHRAGGFRMERFAIPGPQMRGTGGTRVDSHPTQAKLGWGTHDSGETRREVPRMALRRVRPARLVRVVLNPTLPASFPGKDAGRMGQRAIKPVAFSDGENRYEVAAAYGPWKTSGCWWSLDAWDSEEWDVLATANDGATVACLLTRDCARNAWQLEAFYD